MDAVFSASRGSVKPANATYNRSTSQYEITLNENSAVLPVTGTAASAFQVKYQFVLIKELERVESGTFVDVIGVVSDAPEVTEIMSRATGEPMKKRTITLVDKSGASVNLTLWRTTTDMVKLPPTGSGPCPILACRSVKRGDFQGVSLDSSGMSAFVVNPDCPRLLSFAAGGTASAPRRRACPPSVVLGAPSQVTARRSRRLWRRTCRASPPSRGRSSSKHAPSSRFVRTEGPIYYAACPETKKKLTETAPGMWNCESNGKDYTEEEIDWRYLLSIKIADETGEQWVTAFNEGEKLIGITARELNNLQKTDPDAFSRVLTTPLGKPYVFKVKVGQNTYQGETRLRFSLIKAEAVDYRSECKLLLNNLASLRLS
eukprot:TRINITY_DN1219_c0_g1_i1.p1 TRINITY_DN1219_c0_g1~~TRINITY_DN1219_c0_g1_i1.p1  ORF type:complete len:416 (-),score=129.23 TRINITY_DN1219_c0_g1_i1:181-1299(-)